MLVSGLRLAGWDRGSWVGVGDNWVCAARAMEKAGERRREGHGGVRRQERRSSLTVSPKPLSKGSCTSAREATLVGAEPLSCSERRSSIHRLRYSQLPLPHARSLLQVAGLDKNVLRGRQTVSER